MVKGTGKRDVSRRREIKVSVRPVGVPKDEAQFRQRAGQVGSRHRLGDLRHARDRVLRLDRRHLDQALDPLGLLNPGKLVPPPAP